MASLLLLLRLVHLRNRLDWVHAWSTELLVISVQEAQVALPAYRKHAGEHESVGWRNEREAECRDCGPQLERL